MEPTQPSRTCSQTSHVLAQRAHVLRRSHPLPGCMILSRDTCQPSGLGAHERQHEPSVHPIFFPSQSRSLLRRVRAAPGSLDRLSMQCKVDDDDSHAVSTGNSEYLNCTHRPLLMPPSHSRHIHNVCNSHLSNIVVEFNPYRKSEVT